ncbi:hypothetical protein EDC04DRAFT_2603270 [Pisolithus marmoratus]|nr:hypothetical protein EDC04DRAFT_2603270 [Pisolithus marmoratus]
MALKGWAESCEGEDAREEKACPTKAGDYKKAFTAFTVAQRIFKEEMDAYDRERWDTKDPKTIGQRNRIFQQWWESVSDERKAGAGRFETAPGDGKKAFTQSLELSKDWVLNGENSLTDYLEEDSAEKHEVEISLDEVGNPEMPTWSGQKLKVQQNLARAVFQAAYVWGIVKFTKKPKAKVPLGLLIKSPMEYLDSQSIPEGEAGVHSRQTMKSGEVVNRGRDQAPEESSPAWHASKDHIKYLKSLSIMPRYQVLMDLVEAPARRGTWKGERGSPSPLGNMDLECQVFAPGDPFGVWLFLEGPWGITKCEVHFLLTGWGGGSGTCHAQEVEEDDPLVSHLQFLPNSELGIQMVENVMDIVGLIVARLEQGSGMKEPQEGDEGAGMGGSDREDEEKEEEEAPPAVPTQKWKGAESGIVTRGRKVAKQDGKKDKEDGENGKRGVRTWNQTRRAMRL